MMLLMFSGKLLQEATAHLADADVCCCCCCQTQARLHFLYMLLPEATAHLAN
jgi:hypothetical protein